MDGRMDGVSRSMTNHRSTEEDTRDTGMWKIFWMKEYECTVGKSLNDDDNDDDIL
jgi:hypothetical protein